MVDIYDVSDGSFEGKVVSLEAYQELQQKYDAESLEKDYNADQISYGKERAALLQQKLDVMAAENAVLKDINAWCHTEAFQNMYREFKTAEAIGCPDVDCMHDAMLVAIMHAPPTPATDAYLNSVRAEAISSFWENSLCDVGVVLRDIQAFDDSYEAGGIVHSEIKERVDDFVEMLRSGTYFNDNEEK